MVKVSVIIPIYNAEKYLRQCLESILNQTLKEIEVICVDDGSSDSSPEIIKQIAKEDNRVKRITQSNSYAGAARNKGMEYASGKYIYFFDSDDIAAPGLLKRAFERAEETQADIVTFNGYTFENDDLSTKKLKRGYNVNIVKDKYEVFSYKDYPNSILSIVNVVPWNKLIRFDLIKKNHIRFDEIFSTNDIAFSAVCAACAQKIAIVYDSLIYYRIGHSGTVSSSKQKNLNNVIYAIQSVISQIEALDYYELIKPSLMQFVISNLVFGFFNYTDDFSSDDSKNFYNTVRKIFSSPLFDTLQSDYLNEKTFGFFNTIKDTTYEEMLSRRQKEIVVSFTTYPKRISTIHKVIENIAGQTMKPDRVLLYLASEQFPHKNDDLPEELLTQIKEGMVEIKWCDDLRSHKKYFYAMQEYPESLIITVDDDLIYPEDMIQNLYHSYLCHPDCVSAMRAHVTVIDINTHEILPYKKWINEYRQYTYSPSFQLFATSGAGTLYPSGSISKLAFDKERIAELCPLADDVWLNIMSMLNHTKTVCAVNNFYLKQIENTQDDSLFKINVGMNQNDIQYNNVRKWVEKKFSSDIVFERLSEYSGNICFKSMYDLSDYICYLTREKKQQINDINFRLQMTYKEKSEINAKLQKTYREKSEINAKLMKAQRKNNNRLGKVIRKGVRIFKKTPLYTVYRFFKER